MSSFFPTSKSGKGSLPVSTKLEDHHHHHHHHHDAATASSGGGGGLIRRRLSSSSFINNTSPGSHHDDASSNWSFPIRSKSLNSLSFSFSSMGDSIRNWWTWSWAWILSRKPIFATDLEMNEHETKLLASRDKGSWKHVLYRMRSEIRKITNSDYAPLPQTYKPQQSS